MPSAFRPTTTSLGALLVAGSAITWSFGGTIARFISEDNSWVIVFWRSYFAALFLLLFIVMRGDKRGTLRQFQDMGLAGLAVASCFAVASTCFIIALSFTTVANILLIQASVPLIAALLAFLLFGEKPALSTWIAIGLVIAGVAIMVSESLTGAVSPVGDGLALIIASVFALATVITRRHADVRMTPAVCLGTMLACGFSFPFAASSGAIGVSLPDLGLLVLFGAFNLGAGLALFVTGARLIPAAIAALIGTLEPVLAPLWVWLAHDEVPSRMTLVGGTIVVLALVGHLSVEWWRGRT